MHAVFLDPITRNSVGYVEGGAVEYCCTDELEASDLCGKGVKVRRAHPQSAAGRAARGAAESTCSVSSSSDLHMPLTQLCRFPCFASQPSTLSTAPIPPLTQAGGFIVNASVGKPVVVTTVVSTSATSPVAGTAGFEVTVEGPQYVILAACASDGSAGVMPNVALDIEIAFKNPYGFMPGNQYGCVGGPRAPMGMHSIEAGWPAGAA